MLLSPRRAARERRLVALAEAVTEYEERFGVISAQELADQARADRESAVSFAAITPDDARARRRRRRKTR